MVDVALGQTPSGEGSESVAVAASQAVRGLFAELRPLIGDMATRALYVRSLHLARSSFVRPNAADTPALDELLLILQKDLAARGPPEAREAASALLQALVDLLVSLIGEHLTHRMMMSAWGIPPSIGLSEEKPK